MITQIRRRPILRKYASAKFGRFIENGYTERLRLTDYKQRLTDYKYGKHHAALGNGKQTEAVKIHCGKYTAKKRYKYTI